SGSRRHTRLHGDWGSAVCSSDLNDPRQPGLSAYRIVARVDARRAQARLARIVAQRRVAARAAAVPFEKEAERGPPDDEREQIGESGRATGRERVYASRGALIREE